MKTWRQKQRVVLTNIHHVRREAKETAIATTHAEEEEEEVDKEEEEGEGRRRGRQRPLWPSTRLREVSWPRFHSS